MADDPHAARAVAPDAAPGGVCLAPDAPAAPTTRPRLSAR